MIKSMTGFGSSSHEDGQLQITAEVKTLNSKFLDINLRLPKAFSDREMEVRNLLSEKLERGKVAVALDAQYFGDQTMKQTYNETLFVAYYSELKRLADKVVSPYDNLFEQAINAPDVIQSNLREESNDQDWAKVLKVLNDAVARCNQFRITEGNTLEKVLNTCCQVIGAELKKVEELDPIRVQRVRDRLKGNTLAFFGEEGYDTNRLEQEIIFYIEKLDIAEEKVRLRSHLDYFLVALAEAQSNGKKLGFIAQEIGREINTIGSKANDAAIQKHVILMKEELEKIKEQLNNVL